MAEISEVSGITGSTLDLFRSAGLETAESLIARTVSDILAELDGANAQNEIPVRRPSEDSIRAWQESARSLLRREGMPVAKVVAEDKLQSAGIEVSAMPVAKVVEEPLAQDRKEETRPPEGTPELLRPRSVLPQGAEAPDPPPEGGAGTAKIKEEERKPASPAGKPARGTPEAKPTPEAGRGQKQKVSLPGPKPNRPAADSRGSQRGPEPPPEWEYEFELDPATNRFQPIEVVRQAKRQGERRNRGMSHPEPGRVRLAAAVTVLAPAASLVTAIVLVAALVMARLYDWHFDWTISLLLLVFPASLVLYLTLGAKVRCRLCGQRLFVPRHCLKHERAKRSLFGYTYAVARDALLRASYRCMLCGTKTRLKN